MAVLHMNSDFERSGDEAKKFARKARGLRGRTLPISMERIDSMAAIVCEMIRTGTDAFVQQDAKACEPLLARDREVDDLRDELFERRHNALEDEPNDLGERRYQFAEHEP